MENTSKETFFISEKIIRRKTIIHNKMFESRRMITWMVINPVFRNYISKYMSETLPKYFNYEKRFYV